jgi:prophage DNA circulation protein
MSRLKAFIDHIELDMEKISDDLGNDLVKHRYPYRSGAQLENMGAKERSISCRCYFMDNRYADHYEFLDYILQAGQQVHTLRHPVYGIIKGKIESAATVFDNEFEECAIIDIVFVEGLWSGFSQPQQAALVETSARASYQSLALAQIMTCVADCIDRLGHNARAWTAKVLEPGDALVDSFNNLSLSARNALGAIDSAINKTEALASSVTVGVDAAVSSVEYPSTIPGRIIGAFGRVSARYAESLRGVYTSPDHFLSNLSAAFTALISMYDDDVMPFKKYVTVAAAATLTVETAAIYQIDEENRAVLKNTEQATAFDAAGNYRNLPLAPAIMTVGQLETTLANARKMLQLAIDVSRESQELKVLARALLDHVNRVKINRESLVEKDFPEELPLHFICMREGLPAQYAERILTANPHIKNPSFVQGKVLMYAR